MKKKILILFLFLSVCFIANAQNRDRGSGLRTGMKFELVAGSGSYWREGSLKGICVDPTLGVQIFNGRFGIGLNVAKSWGWYSEKYKPSGEYFTKTASSGWEVRADVFININPLLGGRASTLGKLLFGGYAGYHSWVTQVKEDNTGEYLVGSNFKGGNYFAGVMVKYRRDILNSPFFFEIGGTWAYLAGNREGDLTRVNPEHAKSGGIPVPGEKFRSTTQVGAEIKLGYQF
jgi:hypothetical protein